MKNENDKWIMDGIDWNNPECIHTVDEAIAYINKVGFLPLLRMKFRAFRWKSELPQNIGGQRIQKSILGSGERLLPVVEMLLMENFLIRKLDLFLKNGCHIL